MHRELVDARDAGGAAQGFVLRVLESLRSEPLARVVLPPGRSEPGAIDALLCAANAEGYRTSTVHLDSIAKPPALLDALSDAVGCEQSASSLAHLLAQLSEFFQPRLVVLRSDAPKGEIASIVERAREVAEASRDLRGRVVFVWVHRAAQLHADATTPYEVWPMEWRHIPLLDFAAGTQATLDDALRIYVDRRIFWESAGQPDRFERLHLALRANRRSLAIAHEADATIDAVFDADPIPDEERSAVGAALADRAASECWQRAFASGAEPAGAKRQMREWHACGLIWRPPGMSRWRMTPLGLRVLLESTHGGLAATLGAEAIQSRLRTARASAQLGQMVLILARQVEDDLLTALRHGTDWNALIDAAQLRALLEVQQKRSALRRAGAPTRFDCLLDYATFGQLVRVAQHARSEFQFALSLEYLWNVADIRNRAAHGDPVRWSDLRLAVQAVAHLSTA